MKNGQKNAAYSRAFEVYLNQFSDVLESSRTSRHAILATTSNLQGRNVRNNFTYAAVFIGVYITNFCVFSKIESVK
jgi:hypothetical protein